MRKIKMLVKDMREELCDAEKYAKRSAEFKDDDRELSSMYRQLAEQELAHADQQHSHAVALIREYKQSGKETPAAMQAVWDWEHEQMIEHEAEIRAMLSR